MEATAWAQQHECPLNNNYLAIATAEYLTCKQDLYGGLLYKEILHFIALNRYCVFFRFVCGNPATWSSKSMDTFSNSICLLHVSYFGNS